MDQAIKAGGTPWLWTDGRKQVDLGSNVWGPMIGFEYTISKAGALGTATINGKPITRAETRQLLASRCFVDARGLQIGGPLRFYWDQIEAGILAAGHEES